MRNFILVCTSAAAISGCGMIQPVQPWEKGTLARPEMTIQGNDALERKFTDHFYATREASSGGGSIGGGGCGCN